MEPRRTLRYSCCSLSLYAGGAHRVSPRGALEKSDDLSRDFDRNKTCPLSIIVLLDNISLELFEGAGRL